MVACSEKKSDKATDGTNPADIQNKMRSFVSPKNFSEMTINEIHTVEGVYCRPREHVVVAERAIFLSTVQNQGGSLKTPMMLKTR